MTPGAPGPGRSAWPYVRHRRIRGPARGRSRRAPGRRAARPIPAAGGRTQAGRIVLPACAVHARAGGRALPSCTGAWSSRRPGIASHRHAPKRGPGPPPAPGRPPVTGPDGGNPPASAGGGTGDGDSMAGYPLAGLAGAGERLGPDDIGVSRVGRKGLTPGAFAPSPWLVDTDLFHCHLLGHVRARPRGGARPCLRTVLEDGMTRRRREASPEGAHQGGIFHSPPPGTAVLLGRPGARRCRPGIGYGCRVRGSRPSWRARVTASVRLAAPSLPSRWWLTCFLTVSAVTTSGGDARVRRARRQQRQHFQLVRGQRLDQARHRRARRPARRRCRRAPAAPGPGGRAGPCGQRPVLPAEPPPAGRAGRLSAAPRRRTPG